MKVSRNRLGFWQGFFNRKSANRNGTGRAMSATGWVKSPKHKSAPQKYIQMGVNAAAKKYW